MMAKKILLALELLVGATSATLAQDYYGNQPYGGYYGGQAYDYGWQNYGAYSRMNSHQLKRDLGHSRGMTAESQR